MASLLSWYSHPHRDNQKFHYPYDVNCFFDEFLWFHFRCPTVQGSCCHCISPPSIFPVPGSRFWMWRCLLGYNHAKTQERKRQNSQAEQQQQYTHCNCSSHGGFLTSFLRHKMVVKKIIWGLKCKRREMSSTCPTTECEKWRERKGHPFWKWRESDNWIQLRVLLLFRQKSMRIHEVSKPKWGSAGEGDDPHALHIVIELGWKKGCVVIHCIQTITKLKFSFKYLKLDFIWQSLYAGLNLIL